MALSMALSLALPLSGLGAEHFAAMGARILFERGEEMLAGRAPISPRAESESSGFASLTPSSASTPIWTPQLTPQITPPLTPSLSRPDTPSLSRPGTPSEEVTKTQDTSYEEVTETQDTLADETTKEQDTLADETTKEQDTLAEETTKEQDTLAEETTKEQKLPVRIYYCQRDILNLAANLREPYWQMRMKMKPRYDYIRFAENKSVHCGLGEHGLIEDYPMEVCEYCDFYQPSQDLV